MKTTDQVKQLILGHVAGRKDLTLQGLSRQIGRKDTYLKDFIRKGSPRELHERDRRQLAAIFGISEDELKVESPPKDISFRPSSPPLPSTPRQPVVTEQRDLPILGHAKGGEGGFFFANGEIAGFTMRPTILVGVDGAYAVEMWDSSMAPAIKHGLLCWVHPRKAIHPDDDVVVQLKTGEAYIKNLVRRTGKELILQQYNPPQQIKIPASEVKDVHLIVGSLRVRT